MTDAIDATKQAFIELDHNHASLPLRTPIEIPAENGLSLFMPAYLPELDQLGIKVASIFPNNSEKDIPAITGVVLLLDSKTGAPKALLDASYLTALRTGASSGVATDLLAKPDAKQLAIIGAGAQAKTQLSAVLAVRDITDIAIYSRSHQSRELFAGYIKEKYKDLQVTIADAIDSACHDADIICTATNSTEPLVYLDDIKDDCHINAIGSHNESMHEIDISVIKQAKVIVDQKHASLKEAGEIIRAIKAKLIEDDDLLELGYILNHQNHYIELKQQLTVFKSVGIAIQDLTVASKALELAEADDIGTMVSI